MTDPAAPLNEIVVATGNPHKVRELNAMLTSGQGRAGLRFRSLADLPGGPWTEPVEDGGTFEANAAIKARSYAQQTGMVCLADDSGLMVDALGGAPGVISSHYATDGKETGLSREERDAANNLRLIADIAHVAEPDRTARFVCVMVLALPSEGGESTILARTRGEFVGRIGMPGPSPQGGVPRGTHGFGYDPLFLVAPSHEQTSAELDPAVKNAVSHRAKAATAMIERIDALRASE